MIELRRNGKRLEFVTSDITDILGISDYDVGELVRTHLLEPAVSANKARSWRAEDIFRGFVAIVLVQEFEDKYGSKKYKAFKYKQVRYDLIGAIRKPERFLETPEWEAVVERAREQGINFAGTNLDYTGVKKS